MSNTATALLVLACLVAVYDVRQKTIGVGTVRVIASLCLVAVVLVYRLLT